MKYLCVNPHGDLEIWYTSHFGNYWICDNGFGSLILDSDGIGGPQQTGREILEEWEE
jgi:hypothetical protein